MSDPLRLAIELEIGAWAPEDVRKALKTVDLELGRVHGFREGQHGHLWDEHGKRIGFWIVTKTPPPY